MAIHQRLKNWFRQKSRSRKNGQEETVAVPEVHTGKVRHEAADSTPEADCPIHYDKCSHPGDPYSFAEKIRIQECTTAGPAGQAVVLFCAFSSPTKTPPAVCTGRPQGVLGFLDAQRIRGTHT